jgi:Holliday junction resolvase RusA-like endonuclease
MKIEFTVNGEPIAKERPRVVFRKGFLHTYTPAKTLKYEKSVSDAFITEAKREHISIEIVGKDKHGRPIYKSLFGKSVPVSIEIDAVFGIPKSYSKKKRKAALDGTLGYFGVKDIDNIVKSVLDALVGCCFQDDRQIVSVKASKRFGESPFIRISISN